MLGVAIIGCGTVSGVHIHAIKESEYAVLKAVVDVDREKGTEISRQHSCDYYHDYIDAFKRDDIDVVHICTDHHLHSAIAIEALKHRKHVLCEKPLAHDLYNAREVLSVSEQCDRLQFGVVFQNRYNESSRIMKRFVDSKEMGNIIGMKGIVAWSRDDSYYTGSNWKGGWDTEGGGVLINQAIHTIDLLRWLGGEVDSVKGSVSTDLLNIEVEDTAHAIFKFKSGLRAILYATNTHVTNSPIEIEVVFEKGRLLLQDDTLYLIKDKQMQVLIHKNEQKKLGKSYWGYGHEILINDFYEHILHNKAFEINGHEGYETLKLVKAIYESSEKNAELSIPSI
ncbi:Gfo/Idh/MocA family protein [Paenibacillus humicus]|uniref:Gfo/Idh/MocA family protein n=1 Tax=Paenibacillus humicus TaxID=412861 RepID=UPI003D289122